MNSIKMVLEEKIAKAFKLEGENWLKHANPWSIWTRFFTLPFIILAFWSRVWFGWYSLIPIGGLFFWIYINPTLFGKPKHFDHWGSKAVLGERLWSERKTNPVPTHHHMPIFILTLLQSGGGIFLIYGLWVLSLNSTLFGMTIIYLSKMWFLDRMVWIFMDFNPLEKIK